MKINFTKADFFLTILTVIIAGTGLYYIILDHKNKPDKSENAETIPIKPSISTRFEIKATGYPLGQYIANEVPTVMASIDSFTSIIKSEGYNMEAFDTLDLEIKIGGKADSIRFKRGTKYDGRVGKHFCQCFSFLGNMHLSEKCFEENITPMDNINLCILRGVSFFNELKIKNPIFMNKQICISVNICGETGAEYRGVDAVFIFKPKKSNYSYKG